MCAITGQVLQEGLSTASERYFSEKKLSV